MLKSLFRVLENVEFLNRLRNSHLGSPLLLGSDAPHVHPRPRKRLARCTLDCGFKTSESPALRGFVGGLRALATAALSCAKIERPSPLEKPSCKVRFFVQNRFRIYRQKVTVTMLFQTAFHRIFQLLPQTAHICFHRRKWVHLGFANRIAHKGTHGETGGVLGGGGITALGAFRTFTNIPGPGVRTANFAAFGSWPGVLSKNAESLRNSDALMRVAVPQASRPRWAA